MIKIILLIIIIAVICYFTTSKYQRWAKIKAESKLSDAKIQTDALKTELKIKNEEKSQEKIKEKIQL